MPPPEIQHLQSDARPAFTTLAREVDWGMTAADVDPVFELGEVFGALGPRGELWAAAALFPCGDLAAIGMMMVRPSLQRRGFGRRVIDACLQALPAKTPVTLVSSPAGLGFYRRLGFVDAGTVHKLVVPRALGSRGMPGLERVRALETEDWGPLLRWDREVFGADREALLRTRAESPATSAVLLDPGGALEGYALGTVQQGLLMLGPVVAPDLEGALALIHTLGHLTRHGARIDVPGHQPGLLARLNAWGFVQTYASPAMLLNARDYPGLRPCVFGLGSQMYG